MRIGLKYITPALAAVGAAAVAIAAAPAAMADPEAAQQGSIVPTPTDTAPKIVHITGHGGGFHGGGWGGDRGGWHSDRGWGNWCGGRR